MKPTPETVEQLKSRLAAAEKELRAIQKHNLTADVIRREIYDLPVVSTPPTWLTKTSTRDPVSHRPATTLSEVPMTIWSDWHWGELVDPEQVGGTNKFNRKIARERVKRLVTATIDLAKNHNGNIQDAFDGEDPNTYPGIVVALGGDMITGAIHDELRETNDGSVMQAMLEVEEALIWGLGQMADEFGHVFVPCVVGNHGRGTLKPRAKGRVHDALEWNIYCHLERWFRNDKRLLFQVPGGTDAYFKVFDHRFMLTHGDSLGVKGGDGIIGAIGPITRGTFKIGRQQSRIGRDIDTLVMGHWHAYMPRGEMCPVIVNPSLIGPSEFGHLFLRAPPGQPSQALWWLHPVRGVTAQRQVTVEPTGRLLAGTEWVSFERRK